MVKASYVDHIAEIPVQIEYRTREPNEEMLFAYRGVWHDPKADIRLSQQLPYHPQGQFKCPLRADSREKAHRSNIQTSVNILKEAMGQEMFRKS